MKGTAYKLSSRARAKIVLHACKFSSCPVNGALLGRAAGGDQVEIVDAVPFFHSNVELPLRLEVALAHVCALHVTSDAYAKKNGLQLVGFYHGAESLAAPKGTDATAQIVMEKIAHQFPAACLLVINNEEFKAPFDKCFQVYTVNGTQLAASKDEQQLSLAASDVEDLVRTNTFRDLADFEDHLRDTRLDWLNPSIAASS